MFRREKNFSCAARNRVHSASSTSRGARPAAFHSFIRARYALAVSPQSVASESASALAISASLASLAAPRCLSSSAKCEPRWRVKVSRALANRFHSASSVFRSIPRMARHSSTIALSRSPVAFHCVDSASSSASTHSASLALMAAARAAVRACEAPAMAASAAPMTISSRAAALSRSPIAGSVSTDSRSATAWCLVAFGSPVPEARRASSRAISVEKSSNRRPKWASPASTSPACQLPIARSPAAVVT